MDDPKFIWLEPVCNKDGAPHDDRMWCQDDVWGECDCGECHKSVKYIRADIVAAIAIKD